MKNMKSSLGISRKWDAREAGREVARSAIQEIKRPPTFFVLFSTIHYTKNNGLEELLNGVWDVLPKGTPLIGGTVRGFVNNYGCYTRGVTALAVSNEEMDVAVGVGKNTKRNPKKAAKDCATMIKNKLENSRYNKKFLLHIISGAAVPDIPPLGRKKIIEPGLTPKALIKIFGVSQNILQKGYARDDEILDEMINQFPEYSMLGGACLDNGPNLANYQFYNEKVLTNSVVSLGIRTNCNLGVKTTHNMKKTGIEFKITKMSKDGRLIHEINGNPAVSEILRLLHFPKEALNEDTWLKTTFYFPLGSFYNDSKTKFGPRVMGIILGNSIIMTFRSKDTNGSILTIDGRSLLDTIDRNLELTHNQPEFGLIASCTTRLETLGDKVFQAQDRVKKYFGDNPFIIFYVGGESTYSPEKGLDYANMSFNSALFWN